MKANQLIPTEDQEQIVLAQWLDMHHILWTHCPNEGKRSRKLNPKTGKYYSTTGQKLQAKGLKKGFPDAIIFDSPPGSPHIPGTAIELKRIKGSSVTDEQIQWLEKLKQRGWAVAICNGAGDAIKFLEDLGYGRRREERSM